MSSSRRAGSLRVAGDGDAVAADGRVKQPEHVKLVSDHDRVFKESLGEVLVGVGQVAHHRLDVLRTSQALKTVIQVVGGFAVDELEHTAVFEVGDDGDKPPVASTIAAKEVLIEPDVLGEGIEAGAAASLQLSVERLV